MEVGILYLRLSRLTDWNLTPAAIVKTVLHGFSVGKGLNLGRKTQALPDSWSICCLHVWIAPFRVLRYRAADARLCVTFCGLAGCCPIPWSAKVRPAYRASNVPPKTARNEKSSVPRSIRSTGLSYVVDFWLHSHRCFSCHALCKVVIKPVFDTGNIAVCAVGVDGVKMVVDGNIPHIVLWKSKVNIKPGQRGISSQSG